MYLLYILRGVLSRNLPSKWKRMRGAGFKNCSAAIVIPFKIKYATKKLEAFGRFFPRRFAVSVGLSMIWLTTDAAPELKVVIRKTWMTWNAKYQAWVFSSTRDRVGSPTNLARTRQRLVTS
jgi:hypothetical protein